MAYFDKQLFLYCIGISTHQCGMFMCYEIMMMIMIMMIVNDGDDDNVNIDGDENKTFYDI